MRFSYRIFQQGSDTLLAISDDGIVGKTFSSKEAEITVSKEFYCDKSCDESKVLQLVAKATIINAIGKDVINLLAKTGLVDESSVLLIGDIPHAQIITIG